MLDEVKCDVMTEYQKVNGLLYYRHLGTTLCICFE